MPKLGHNPDGLVRKFMDKYKDNFVPVKKSGLKGHDGEKGKPETGKMVKASFYFC